MSPSAATTMPSPAFMSPLSEFATFSENVPAWTSTPVTWQISTFWCRWQRSTG
jgi:hypothetical protein